MSDLLRTFYKAIWNTAGKLLSWLDDAREKSTRAVLVIGALAGILGAEAIYFSSAKEVRLLYVLLVAIPGAGVGTLAAGLLGGLVLWVAGFFVVATAGVLSLVPVGVAIWLLYLLIRLLHAIVVWRN